MLEQRSLVYPPEGCSYQSWMEGTDVRAMNRRNNHSILQSVEKCSKICDFCVMYAAIIAGQEQSCLPPIQLLEVGITEL